jgi:hypothetical protein
MRQAVRQQHHQKQRGGRRSGWAHHHVAVWCGGVSGVGRIEKLWATRHSAAWTGWSHHVTEEE